MVHSCLEKGTIHYSLKVSTPKSSSGTITIKEEELFSVEEYEAMKKKEEIVGQGMLQHGKKRAIKTRQKDPLHSLLPFYNTDHQTAVEEAFMELFGCCETDLSPLYQDGIDRVENFP